MREVSTIKKFTVAERSATASWVEMLNCYFSLESLFRSWTSKFQNLAPSWKSFSLRTFRSRTCRRSCRCRWTSWSSGRRSGRRRRRSFSRNGPRSSRCRERFRTTKNFLMFWPKAASPGQLLILFDGLGQWLYSAVVDRSFEFTVTDEQLWDGMSLCSYDTKVIFINSLVGYEAGFSIYMTLYQYGYIQDITMFRYSAVR